MDFLASLVLFFSLRPAAAVTEYYVRSNTSTACPTNSTCLTLDEYVSDTETYFTSDTSFLFMEGEHYLSSDLSIEGKNNISMKALNVNVTIVFSLNSIILFSNSEAIVVSSLSIHHRGFYLILAYAALELFDSNNIHLTRINFKQISKFNATEHFEYSKALHMSNSTAHITNCSFLNDSVGVEGAPAVGAIFIMLSTVEFLGYANFVGNHAVSGGAIEVLNSNLTITGKVTFANNSAENGGALYIANIDLNLAAIVGLILELQAGTLAGSGCATVTGTITFTGNSAKNGGAVHISNSHLQLFGNASFETNSAEYGGAVHIENSDLQLLGNALFENNSALTGPGGAVYVDSGSVTLSGATIFIANTAISGGGVAVERSAHVRVLFPFEVTFLSNKAEVGGAIFVDDPILLCSDSRPSCFLELTLDQNSLVAMPTTPPPLNFSRNSARQSGPVIYGGNLVSCQIKTFGVSGIEFLEMLTPIPSTDISPDPLKVCTCDNGTTANCTTSSHSVNVKRGEQFNISLITVGQLDTPVSAQILANSDNGGDVQLDPQFPVSDGTCTNVGITLLADELISNKTLHLYPDGPCGNMDTTRITVGGLPSRI